MIPGIVSYLQKTDLIGIIFIERARTEDNEVLGRTIAYEVVWNFQVSDGGSPSLLAYIISNFGFLCVVV